MMRPSFRPSPRLRPSRAAMSVSMLAVGLLALSACGSSGPSNPSASSAGAPGNESSSSGANGGSSTTAASGSAFQPRGKVIGYSVYDLRQPYWQDFAQGVKDAATKAGYTVVVSDEKSDEQTQVSGSAHLISQNISALIVSPVQPPALPASIQAAHNAHIPIVIGDVGATGDYDAFVLSDNVGGGAKAADFVTGELKAKAGSHEVGVIELHPGSAVGVDRVNGFKNELKKSSGYNIVASLNGNDTVEGGFKATQNMLSANPNLEAIYAANDPEAEGAAQALKQAKNSNVMVIGFNGDAPALQLIKAGGMAATIAQDPHGMGEKCVEIALKLLDGKPVNFTQKDKKVFNFPVTLVDKNNVAKFLSAAK